MNSLNRLTLFAASLALALVFAALPGHAQAQNNVENYRQGMPDLIDFSDRWLDEADAYLATIAAKPEQACGSDYAAFLLRGNSIVADFAGSGWDAPADLVEAHEASAEALAQAFEGVRLVATSCDGSQLEAARAQLNQGRFDFGLHSVTLRHFLKPIFVGSELPSLPITGPAQQ